MQPKTPKLLEDIRDAAAFIRQETDGKTLDAYRADRVLRHAVERILLIHGYDLIDDVQVWGVISNDLPRLEQQVTQLLRENPPPP